MDDHQLLREYSQTGSHRAFRILVHRHIGMVYSAALRMTRDLHSGEKITHGVFATLAKNCAAIKPSDVLARWLHDTTRRLSADALLTASELREGEHRTSAAGMLEPESGT